MVVDDLMFSAGNMAAMVGWGLLIFLPRWRGVAQGVATFAVPGLLAVAYSALIGAWWSRSTGDSGRWTRSRCCSRPGRSCWPAGSTTWRSTSSSAPGVARTARVDGVPHLVMVPVLILTFLFGPIGYLASIAVRWLWKVGTSESGTEGEGKGGWIARSWAGLVGREPRLVAASLGCLALMVPTVASIGLDDRTLDGVDVWFKPLKFEVSLAIYLMTLAWFWPATSDAFRRSRSGRFVVWGSIATSAPELAYILWRAWRGEASHFNKGSSTAAILYALMGVGAVTLAFTGLVLARGVARADARPLPPAYRLGIVLGLVLTFLLGGIEGVVMGSRTGHSVGTSPLGDRPIPVVAWSSTVGDLRIPHFLGLHAQQAIAIVGALAATYLGSKGKLIVVTFAVLYTLANLTLFAQALLGRPAWTP